MERYQELVCDISNCVHCQFLSDPYGNPDFKVMPSYDTEYILNG